MVYIENPSTNPFFNIAAEDYMLIHFPHECIMLYRNEPSVIVGKHQNTLAEINYQYITKNEVQVIRRISGGGAVYHDMGNINFCFIRNGEEGNLVSFELYTAPIIEALGKIGIIANRGNKNDLIVSDKKISGNAERVYKNRVLHHGTLLFNTDLDKLRNSLPLKNNKYFDKSIKSNPGTVANIADLLFNQFSINEFINFLQDFLVQYFKADFYQFSLAEIAKIEHMVEEKFSTWEWNFGYSPAYEFNNEIQAGHYNFKVRIFVDKGIIQNAEVENREISTNLLKNIENTLIGLPHREEMIREKFKLAGLNKILTGISLADFVIQLF